MPLIRLFLLISLIPLLDSCRDDDNGVVCTMEFRSVVISVNGPSLSNYFTIRESTGDTIRINRDNTPGNNDYPVLNDNYQPVLQGRTENFGFKGFINDSLVVNEVFVISADECHINYVSGNTSVNL